MVKDRHPSVAEFIVSALEGGREVRSIQVVTQCTQVLERTGFDCPPWAHLAEGRTPGVAEEEEDLVETNFGQTDFGHRYPTDFGQTDCGKPILAKPILA